MELKDRFLKYVSYDTQSSEQSRTFPSTDKQLVLLRELADEMKALGMTEVTMDAHGYVMGTVPATPGCESNVKEIFDKTWELKQDPSMMIFNQLKRWATRCGTTMSRATPLQTSSRP